MQNSINKEPFSIRNDAYESTYYLYANDVRLRNGWEGKTYYFSKEKNRKALLELPEGYEVVEGPLSKMFFLRKKGPKTKKHVKVIKTT